MTATNAPPKTRSELKKYFGNVRIPDRKNFAHLIDAMTDAIVLISFGADDLCIGTRASSATTSSASGCRSSTTPPGFGSAP